MYRWIISLGNLILFINVKIFHCDKTKNKDFVLHCCPWFDLKWVGYVSKLLSKCLPFRASLWAFLSAFYWRFCLVGLSVYSYSGLEAHVCDGLSGWKKYVTCVKTLLLLSLLIIVRKKHNMIRCSNSIVYCDRLLYEVDSNSCIMYCNSISVSSLL